MATGKIKLMIHDISLLCYYGNAVHFDHINYSHNSTSNTLYHAYYIQVKHRHRSRQKFCCDLDSEKFST